MKTNIILLVTVIGLSLSALPVCAQPSKAHPYSGKNPREIRQVARPDGFASMKGLELTEEQRDEIRKIRVEGMKGRTQERNQLKEKSARLEVLQTTDKPDMKEINKVIDEIASIRAKTMKDEAVRRQKIRSLLNDEQRVYFDVHYQKRNHDLRSERPHRPHPGDSPSFRKRGLPENMND